MTKKEARTIFKEGNGKLSKSILVWGLPAGSKKDGGTCSVTCKGCYAYRDQKGRFGKTISKSRNEKYKLSQSKDFMFKAIDAINTLGKTKVRIHESGDFYSQEYINKWIYIASSLPHVIFTAYTKEINNFDFSVLSKLDNVILIDSLKGGRVNYGDIDKKPINAFLCPCNVVENTIGCGHDCNICYEKENKTMLQNNGIYFKAH